MEAGRHGGMPSSGAGAVELSLKVTVTVPPASFEPELHGPGGIVNVGNHRGVRVGADDLTGQCEACQGQYQAANGWSNGWDLLVSHTRLSFCCGFVGPTKEPFIRLRSLVVGYRYNWDNRIFM